ncbi:MAG: DUF4112 domain-containing protein [Phocaeicola sp.]
MKFGKRVSSLRKSSSHRATRSAERAVRRGKKQEELEASSSYTAVKTISKVMDEYYLDGIIGFIPVVGDMATLFTGIPSLYVALCKVKSIPLTLAVLSNLLLDTLVGMIPFWIGNICDFFFRGNIRNFKLIVGFVEADQAVIREVNRRAIGTLVWIGVLCYLIYLMIGVVADLATWVLSLFGV